MSFSQELFTKRGGYRKLHSFTFATLIHLGTIRFCKKFIPYRVDQLGKTTGQMVGAARSGRQNIIEASERAATSKETEIKLTDVARGSLVELQGDYEVYLADKGVIPWSKAEQERQKIGDIWLPEFEYTDDSVHDYWQYYHKIKLPFAPWLENEDDTVVANAMIILIQRATAMLDAQIKSQGDSFVEQGGFRERMYNARSAERDKNANNVGPKCPECGNVMYKRMPRKGKNTGIPFWGCSAYPNCRGVVAIAN